MLYLFLLGCLNKSESDRVDEPTKTVVEEVDDENKETEVLIAEVKDVSLDVRRRTKDNQTYFNVFFEEGVFRGEFVEKYDNQDLSSQNLLRMYVQRKGDKKKTFGRVVLRSSNEVDFYPENFSIEETPNQQFEVFVESSTLAIGDIETEKDGKKTIVFGLRLKPKKGTEWTGAYETSKFTITSLYLDKFKNMRQADFILRTSYPINKDEILSHLSIEVRDPKDKSNTTKIFSNYASVIERKPTEFVITINHPLLEPKKIVDIEVKDLPYSKDNSIIASRFSSAHLRESENIDMYGPYLIENSQGFGIEYICNDRSVDDERYYSRYDNGIDFYDYISERCALRKEDIERNLQFDPPLPDGYTIVEKRHGFLVLGDFQRGNLKVRLSEGVRSIDNGMIKKGIESDLRISKRKPLIQFLSKGRYLPVESWTKIPFRVRNTGTVKMTVREIQEHNLHNWMSKYNEMAESQHGDVILEKEISINTEIDSISTQQLDLSELLDKRTTGIYEIQLRDTDNGIKDYLRVQVTNTALITKKHDTDNGRQYHVWAIDNKTLDVLPGTKVSLHRPSGTKSTECITDNDGFCSLDVENDTDNRDDYVLFAKRISSDGREELTYLPFGQLEVNLSEYDIHGASGSANTYRISAHTERGAYRPGDSIHTFALIRGQDNEAPKENLPVHLEVINARGQNIKQYKLQTNKAGVVETSIELPPKAATGAWMLRWQVGADKETRRKNTISPTVRVENFVPERMNVAFTFDKAQDLPSDIVGGNIKARYLFGSPAKDAAFEVTCRVESAAFTPRKNGNYQFGSPEAFGAFKLGRVKGKLDENGEAQFACPSPERLKELPGMAKVIADIDVMEGGSGRSTHRSTSMMIHPQKHYIGLLIGTDSIGSGKQYPVSGIVVDWQGNIINDVSEVVMQKSQVEIGYSWYYDDFGYSSQRYKQEIPLEKETVAVKDGRFTYQIQGDAYVREYRIRAQSGNIVSLLDIAGSRYSYYSSGDYDTPDPMKPDMLDISVPRSITRSETVTVKVAVPYTGKILWTVEGDGVVRKKWMDVTPEMLQESGTEGEVSWRFDIKDMEYRNNVYVSAMLLKNPHLESSKAFLPSRALGVATIPVRDEKWSQKVTISTPEEVKANQTLKVSLDVNAGSSSLKDAVAMISVVDEGLLSLTNHPSPNPTKSLFPKMPLNVQTFETIGWSVPTPSTGDNVSAGGGADGARRAKVVKPVALWSGIVDIPQDGKVDVDFDIPQYSGEVRVMVVTASPQQFGYGKDNVFVRDPLTVQATLPRFITKGDVVQIPAFVTNLSGKEQEVELELRVRDGENPNSDPKTQKLVKFLGASSTKIKMKKDEQFTGVFRVEVLQEVGFGIFEVVAKAKGIESKDVLEVPFHSQKPVEREITQIHLSDVLGESLEGKLNLSQDLQGWSTSETQLLAVSHPYGKSFAHVKHLLRYPYGCAEQTSSSLRPLLTMKNIIEQVDPTLLKKAPGTTNDEKIADMVEHGITRLASMHNSGSGFAYWPGSRRVHPWATVYAMHVLLDAKKAGYSVNQNMLDDATRYMSDFVAGNYNSNSYYGSSTLAKSYMHYLLAREGSGRPNQIRDELKKTNNIEAKHLLAAALFLSGDRSYEKMLKEPQAQYNTSRDWRYFSSNDRANGLILTLHQELAVRENWPAGSGDPLAQTIASTLERAKSSYYFSTQELAWMTYGLASRVTESKNWKPPIVESNGRSKKSVRSNSGSIGWDLYDTARNKEELTLRSGGSDTYVILSTEGVRENGVHTYGSEGLQISRVYKTPDNKAIDWNNHQLGDEVVVTVTVRNTAQTDLNELALIDHIPSGWEIQNPALGRGDDFSEMYTSDKWESEYTDVQDSEMRVFGDIEAYQTVQFIYSIRATSAGSFFIPPVEIEAMYNHKIWAREAGMNIEVQGPFEKDFL